jgi:hypothetical protein
LKSTQLPVVHRETALLREFVSLRRDAWIKRNAALVTARQRRGPARPVVPSVAPVHMANLRLGPQPKDADAAD